MMQREREGDREEGGKKSKEKITKREEREKERVSKEM